MFHLVCSYLLFPNKKIRRKNSPGKVNTTTSMMTRRRRHAASMANEMRLLAPTELSQRRWRILRVGFGNLHRAIRFASVFVITLSALIIASHWPWWQRVVGGGSSLMLL